MKYFNFSLFLFPFYSFAQIPNGTDIFLADCKFNQQKIIIENPVNITQREGYDNQPRFADDGKSIYYVAIKEDKQADIYNYDIATKAIKLLTTTAESEYSPIITPNQKSFSVVRVEKDSTQRLWQFPLDCSRPSLVCSGIDSIGYYNWVSDTSFVFFKVTEPPTLWLANTKNNSEKYLTNKCGRSIHKKNNSEIYFTQVIDTTRWICSMNLNDKKIKPIVACISGSEDFIAPEKGYFIEGSGSKLFSYSDVKSKTWQQIADFSQQGVASIKRISMSNDKTKIAFVSDNSKP